MKSTLSRDVRNHSMNVPNFSPVRSPRTATDSLAVENLADRSELRRYLVQDKLANAYLLGLLRDLDPEHFPDCNWYGTRAPDGSLEGVLCVYSGLSLPAVVAIGSEVGVEALLEACADDLPDRFRFYIAAPHLDTLQWEYDVSKIRRIRRMGLHRSDYRSTGPPAEVRRLGHADTAAIMRLYEFYPDNLFEPSQLETGLYFGIDDDEGRLLSIAGIHVVSDDFDVAAIGNLVTRPSARGRGFATACTNRLLDELFERVSLVALNVREDNDPAIAVYERFGFRPNTTFWEGRADARSQSTSSSS